MQAFSEKKGLERLKSKSIKKNFPVTLTNANAYALRTVCTVNYI